MTNGPWRRFDDFIAPGADRRAILAALFDEYRLAASEEMIAGNRHLFLGPGPEKPGLGATRFPRGGTILVAHYDRAPGSPGANDNSAAVFLLMETALKLYASDRKNWLIIFTDKEELGPGGSIREQGSYTLAASLRESGLGSGSFYIFDACGVGDWFIISTMADYMLREETGVGAAEIRKRTRALRGRALDVTRKLNIEKVLLAPAPFSDDLGFLRAGITAQVITMLPAPEANRLASELRNHPGFTDSLIKGEARRDAFTALLPETWKTLNTPADEKSRLTPEHFRQTVRFAAALPGA